ncbi:MAG: TonB-dependent receptor plug domain-containing protein, partial [Candidatus Cloacimonetes bacterium]|nr:TonB-dependent receptor plug domain-containing protein [Candidatus Cloacimonadota bacterium]
MKPSISRRPPGCSTVRVTRLTALCLLAGLAQSLQAASLQGTVVDESRSPLTGAHVQVRAGSRVLANAATDSLGQFLLEGLPEAPLVLRLSYLGHRSLRETVTPPSRLGELVLASVALEPGELIVSADRARPTDAASYSTIDGEELELRHQGQDLARLLDGTPGLVSFSYGGNPAGYSEIRLRGFDQKRVDVQLNGVPLNDPEDHYVYWVDLPDMGSSLVEAQVQRGTGVAATGGNNFGGAVRLSTGFSPTPGLGLEAGVGSFGTRRQALTWSSGRQQDGWQLETRFSQLR